MCEYVYVCMYVYVNARVCVGMCLYVTYAYTRMCMYVYVCVLCVCV